MINLKRLPKKPTRVATFLVLIFLIAPLPRMFAESVPVAREAASVRTPPECSMPEASVSAADNTPVKPYTRRPSKDALKWADKQLKQMSLEQKVGQLISVGINATYLNQDSAAFNALRH